jgi:regulatory protein
MARRPERGPERDSSRTSEAVSAPEAASGFSRDSERRAARKPASGLRSGFGSSARKGKTADDGGFTRSSERATRKPAAAPAESVAEGEYTRSSQQVLPRKPLRPDGPSLKMRAADYLSRREHSRVELARKLARWSEDRDEIDAVLDALTREGWMSTERFVQSVVHRRASRQGTSRIVQELRQHGVDNAEIEAVKPALQASEFARAQEVWRKRFGDTPPDREGWAKQARFLAARGFSHDVIRRVLGGDEGDA